MESQGSRLKLKFIPQVNHSKCRIPIIFYFILFHFLTEDTSKNPCVKYEHIPVNRRNNYESFWALYPKQHKKYGTLVCYICIYNVKRSHQVRHQIIHTVADKYLALLESILEFRQQEPTPVGNWHYSQWGNGWSPGTTRLQAEWFLGPMVAKFGIMQILNGEYVLV